MGYWESRIPPGQVHGVDDFVQVNLSCFTILAGYFGTAYEAGKNTFTQDREYLWYGMLLRRVAGTWGTWGAWGA